MTDRDDVPRQAAEGSRGGRKEKFDMDTWWEDRSLPAKILLGIGFGVAGVGLLALAGWVVMLLWNWLMPDMFGLKPLGYWKAWGLLALCWILFRGVRLGSSESGRGTDRKRRRELRRYVREEQGLADAGAARRPEA